MFFYYFKANFFFLDLRYNFSDNFRQFEVALLGGLTSFYRYDLANITSHQRFDLNSWYSLHGRDIFYYKYHLIFRWANYRLKYIQNTQYMSSILSAVITLVLLIIDIGVSLVICYKSLYAHNVVGSHKNIFFKKHFFYFETYRPISWIYFDTRYGIHFCFFLLFFFKLLTYNCNRASVCFLKNGLLFSYNFLLNWLWSETPRHFPYIYTVQLN